jgi:adenylate cyclase, class 2
MTTESGVHEVERRYRVSSSRMPQVEACLDDMGFSRAYTQRQVDQYYTSKHKDFISTRECLRIRFIDGRRTVLTWKPPSTDEMRAASEFWKQEIEFAVDASLDTVKQFLIALDFVPYVTVDKTRTAYHNSAGVEIALDEVIGLGWFVELEVQSAYIDAARKEILRLAEELDLKEGNISTIPYRDLVNPQS